MISRRVTFILVGSLLLSFSCSSYVTSQNYHKSGKLSIYSSINKKSFSFVIKDEFKKSDISKIDPSHPKLTKSETSLLKLFLKKNNYCINNNGKLIFKITSKQLRIYDVTLSSLVERQYNAKPITPVTYFGECA